MTIVSDWDKAFKANLSGMSVWPLWNASVGIGDIGDWKLGPNQRKFTTTDTASSLGVRPSDYQLRPSPIDGNCQPNLSITSGVQISGSLDVQAQDIPVDGGTLDASATVTFTKSDNFYLFTPSYALQAAGDLNGLIKASWDAYEKKNGDYPTDKFLVFGLYIAYGGGVFLASSSSDVSATVGADYSLDTGGTVTGSFTVDVKKGNIDSTNEPSCNGGSKAVFGMQAIRWKRKAIPKAGDWDDYVTNPLVG